MMVNKSYVSREMDKSSNSSSSSGIKPAWLEGLMADAFFVSCEVHKNQRKNEKNIFCLLCSLSICPHCLPSHCSHPLLQVRRYVYHDVLRLGDLDKLIDCSYIQPYTINGAKVIFLKQRLQTRNCKGSANICFTCERILQKPFNFCSLSCKVDHLVFHGGDLSSILYRFDESDFTISQFEGLQMDGSEEIDDDSQVTTSSMAEENMSNSVVSMEQELNKKKKKGRGFLPGIVSSLSSRRKGAPQRAPLS